MIANQTTFIEGLDLIAPDFQISQDGYKMLINARQRLGYIEANKKPIKSTTIPVGKKQGLIALGNIQIAFIAGKAWYNVDGTTLWIRILNFEMDRSIDLYYTIAVPEGTVTYARKLVSATSNLTINRSFDFNINGTPAAILVQDGINQPWVIIFDETTNTFSARRTQTYDEWINDGTHNEYVPIGKQMLIVDQKLYIVSPDNKRVYQSISGRYLDFMVNVDTNGNKLASESQGGASSVSFAFDSDIITCIASVDIPSSFIYGTARNIRLITLDYNNTIFGEPTYYVSAIIEVGVVNQNSIVDILGDVGIVDYEGVKTFDAVKQLKFEGSNSIFSLQLSKLLKGIKQTNPNTVLFNNYALFDLNTTYGRLFAVYDTILKKWVALDSTSVYAVKQFAIIETSSETKLYAINTLDEHYQLYASPTRESAQLHTRTLVATDNQNDEKQVTYAQKSELFKLYFQGGSSVGSCYVTEFVDGQKSINKLRKSLQNNTAGLKFPMSFPLVFDSKPTSEPITYAMKDSKKGHKLSYIIQWDNDSQLQAFQLQTIDEVPVVSKLQQERILS